MESDSLLVLESQEISLNLSLCLDKSALLNQDKVSLFILLYLQKRFPNKWCGGRLKEVLGCDISLHTFAIWQDFYSLSPLLNETFRYCTKKLKLTLEDALRSPIIDIFRTMRLSCIKHNGDNYINHFIIQWANNNRKVCLMDSIPTPWEVLSQQAQGKRVVTMFTSAADLATTHVSKLTYMSGEREHERDAFVFLLHDIRHMEHFFVSDIYFEQVGFFRCCFEWKEMKSVITKVLQHPKSLWHELEYVLSDMNCYSTHLLRYFHAKWLHSFQVLHEIEYDRSQDQQLSRLQADVEWNLILESLFLPKKSRAEQQEELPITEEKSDLDLRSIHLSRESPRNKRKHVISISMKLNLISYREIRDLEVLEWEFLREYFSDIGREVLAA